MLNRWLALREPSIEHHQPHGDTMPTLKENLETLRPLLVAELERLKPTIGAEYRADDESNEPSMQVTLGINEDASGYALQTGDNSYTGAAYSFPHWGVSALARDSDCTALADEILRQCEDLAADA